MKKSALGLYFIFFTTIIFAQEFDHKKLDRYFETLEKNNKFMGSVALLQDGKIIYQNSTGYSSIEKKLKANNDTRYRIGSISKTFTAVLVLKAVEEKKLDINQSIEKFFPDLQSANRISIKQLLRHRSGIHDFTDNTDYYSWNTQSKTHTEILQIISQKEREFQPDSNASYSNTNYVLLSIILETVFSKSYAELVRQYISQPLGLVNTYVGNKINPDNNEAQSYQLYDTRQPLPETDLSIPLGAGNIVSTATDLVKFSDGLFSYKILNKNSLAQMLTIQDHFGMGIILAPFYNHVGYGHTGTIDGFSSVFICFPEDKLSYALTSNGTSFTNNDISTAVLSVFFNKEYIIPEFKTIYTPSSDELDQYVGIYTSPELPLLISITKENNRLVAQASAQNSFLLEAIERNTYKFDQAGIEIEFYPSEKSMILKQAGVVFKFIKDEMILMN